MSTKPRIPRSSPRRASSSEPVLPLDLPDIAQADDVSSSIPWWQSRTVWVQLVAMVFAVGAMFDWWPREISQEETVGAIMLVVTIITVWTRSKATAPLTLTRKGRAG